MVPRVRAGQPPRRDRGGGTTLGIGQRGSPLFETGWSEGISLLSEKSWVFLGEYGAAGGGPSLLWAEPSYQDGVVPTALVTPPGDRGGTPLGADQRRR